MVDCVAVRNNIITPITKLGQAPRTRWIGRPHAFYPENETRLRAMFCKSVEFLEKNRTAQTLSISRGQFNDIWILVRLVYQPAIVDAAYDRLSEGMARRLRDRANRLAKFLNPEWSYDLLKAHLEGPFRAEIAQQLTIIPSLGRFEDWEGKLNKSRN